MRLKGLDRSGIAHLFLLLGVVLAVAIGGTYFLVSSHADSRNSVFIDISSPQCNRLKSIPKYPFGIVGLNGTGLNFASNKCLSKELKHFSSYGLYVGANYPSKKCSSKLSPYECGVKAAKWDLRKARNLHPVSWWIDVESGPGIPWSTQANNADFLKGMYKTLKAAHPSVGFYSNARYWNEITGGARFNAMNWYATGPKSQWTQSKAEYCQKTFGGGNTVYIQYVENDLDHNYVC